MDLDIDVPEKGVKWGKFLRVRICFDATKKLVRGERVSIEGGESRWVFFKYERLPNFCYRCGMLDHEEKECVEKSSSGNRDGEGCMQYEAWLRGEPRRWVGKDQGKSEEVNRSDFRPNREEMTAGKQAQETVQQEEREGAGEGHVIGSGD